MAAAAGSNIRCSDISRTVTRSPGLRRRPRNRRDRCADAEAPFGTPAGAAALVEAEEQDLTIRSPAPRSPGCVGRRHAVLISPASAADPDDMAGSRAPDPATEPVSPVDRSGGSPVSSERLPPSTAHTTGRWSAAQRIRRYCCGHPPGRSRWLRRRAADLRAAAQKPTAGVDGRALHHRRRETDRQVGSRLPKSADASRRPTPLRSRRVSDAGWSGGSGVTTVTAGRVLTVG